MKIGTFKELEAALADTRDKFQTTTLSVKGLLEHAFKLFFELLAIVSGERSERVYHRILYGDGSTLVDVDYLRRGCGSRGPQSRTARL